MNDHKHSYAYKKTQTNIQVNRDHAQTEKGRNGIEVMQHEVARIRAAQTQSQTQTQTQHHAQQQ